MASVFHKRFIAACIVGSAFLALMAAMYVAPHAFLAVDSWATARVQPLQTFSAVELFIAITTVGSVTGIATICCALVIYLRKHFIQIIRLVVLMALSSLTVEGVKMLIGRVRPPALPWLGDLHSYSFPSGHSTESMALFGFIAVFAYTRAHTAGGRFLAISIPGVLIVLIGASRIILAAHYFSDVIAGYLLGSFWLLLVFSIPTTWFGAKKYAH